MLTERIDHPNLQTARPARHERAEAAPWLDWAMVLLCGWFLGGLYIDGWAHSHGMVDSTFFTPWHAIFYSGFAVVALLLGFVLVRNILRGYDWRNALPAGYLTALIGVPLFACAGVGDLLWHELFGIEDNIEALLSPSHLLLASSMGLIISAPLRAAWQRVQPLKGIAQLPMLLSLTFMLSLVTFMTEFAHPYAYGLTQIVRRGSASDSLAVTSILLQSGFLVGVVLLALRRWSLFPGALTLMFALNAALMSLFEDQYWLIGVAALAGLAADLFVAFAHPTPARPFRWRLLAIGIPIVLYLLYFLGIMSAGRLHWSIHLWLGSVVMAGIVGLLVSFLTPESNERVPQANV